MRKKKRHETDSTGPWVIHADRARSSAAVGVFERPWQGHRRWCCPGAFREAREALVLLDQIDTISTSGPASCLPGRAHLPAASVVPMQSSLRMQTQQLARRLLERQTGRWWRGAKTKVKKPAQSESVADTGVTATNAPTERSCEEARTWSALNIVKGGTGPPKQPLSAYPDWLWTLLAPENNLPLRTLRQRFEALVAQGGIANAELKLGHKATQRLLKLQNRAEIKMRNMEGTLLK